MSSKLASVFFFKKNSALNLTGTLRPTNTERPRILTIPKDHGFSANELQAYSKYLNLILLVGVLLYMIVLGILIIQQIKNQIVLRRSKKSVENSPLCKSEEDQGAKTVKVISTAKNNYVTFAFVFHQVIIDLFRISYSFFYSNSLEIESMSRINSVTRAEVFPNVSSNSLFMHDIYDRHCVRMALIYSALNMVTIINILSILISETCRFYDLKLSSTDTSNYCCVLFGVILIWISSLIIISSLMLVGVADSAAPTWKCELNDSESTTRFLVINIVWFLLITFVVTISFFYSCSLYRELSSLDYSHHRLSIFTTNHFTMNNRPNAKFFSRHLRIVNETSKRLTVFIALIIIFTCTFVPNFILTMLKNIIDSDISLKPFNMISAILNQANPTLNSIVLLVLCIISNDTELNKDLNRVNEEEDSIDESNKLPFLKRLQSLRSKFSQEEGDLNDSSESPAKNSLATRLKTMTQEEWTSTIKLDIDCINCESDDKEIKVKSMGNSYSSAKDVKEFYSKIGSRLGRNDD